MKSVTSQRSNFFKLFIMFRLSYQKTYPLLNGHMPIFSQDFNTLEEVNAYKIQYAEFMKDSFNVNVIKL